MCKGGMLVSTVDDTGVATSLTSNLDAVLSGRDFW
jgi:hypothetical protein